MLFSMNTDELLCLMKLLSSSSHNSETSSDSGINRLDVIKPLLTGVLSVFYCTCFLTPIESVLLIKKGPC